MAAHGDCVWNMRVNAREKTQKILCTIFSFLSPFLDLLARAWGFTSLPQRRERLCGLRSDDDGEAIADFQMGIGGRDDLIAITVHADNHTARREPEFMHLLPVKACALLHDELHDQGAMPLHTAAVTSEVPFQQRFI